MSLVTLVALVQDISSLIGNLDVTALCLRKV
jgi:hypothetical protein